MINKPWQHNKLLEYKSTEGIVLPVSELTMYLLCVYVGVLAAQWLKCCLETHLGTSSKESQPSSRLPPKSHRLEKFRGKCRLPLQSFSQSVSNATRTNDLWREISSGIRLFRKWRSNPVLTVNWNVLHNLWALLEISARYYCKRPLLPKWLHVISRLVYSTWKARAFLSNSHFHVCSTLLYMTLC